jgi:pyrophosphatase PpaX
MVKAILFDNDGTLVDTHDMILASMRFSTFEVLGKRIPDDVLMRKVGQPLVVQMRDFTPDEKEQAEILHVYREHNATIHDDMIRAFPGVQEGLKRLYDAGIPMGVVTSKLRVTAWRGLQITGLAPYLGCCIGAEDCVHFKPEAEPVLRGVDALGLQPDDCLYVGDSPFDLQAGRAAGCKTVAVLWGMFSADVLAAECPDYTFASFADFTEACLV